MTRAGFVLIVNNKNEILLIRRKGGIRHGKWSLPGDKTKHGESRSAAARRGTYGSAGIKVAIDHLYYENRHRARIYLGRLEGEHSLKPEARWFPIHKLPAEKELAFAVDVRTVEKWASGS